MIKQNHFPSISAVTVVLVVLLGWGNAVVQASSHKRVHEVLDGKGSSEVKKQSDIKVKDKPGKLSNKSKHIRVYDFASKKKVTAKGYKATGLASWYGFESGSVTAMGTRFNPLALTAAHRTLPLPTKVRVTNLANNMSIIVTINDRGPYIKGRLIDLSLGAARALKMKSVGKVEIEAI